MNTERFVTRLASARIGATFNFYRDGDGAAERRRRLCDYLEDRTAFTCCWSGKPPATGELVSRAFRSPRSAR